MVRKCMKFVRHGILTLCGATLTLSGYAQNDATTIYLNAGAIDTSSPNAPESAGTKPIAKLAAIAAETTTPRLWLVQFEGDITPEKFAGLQTNNTRVICYIPNNAYVLYGTPPALDTVRSKTTLTGGIRYNCEFKPEWKFTASTVAGTNTAEMVRAAAANPNENPTRLWTVQMVSDEAQNSATLELAGGQAVLQKQWSIGPYSNMIMRLPLTVADTLSKRSDVLSVTPYNLPKKSDERQNQILAGSVTAGGGLSGPGYMAWLASKGFTQAQFDASDFLVDVCDSGIDNGTANPGHFALRREGLTTESSRIQYNRLEGSPNSGSTLAGKDGHGNINSHIIGGYVDRNESVHNDASGYKYGLGVCPFVKMGSSVVFDPDSWTNPNFPDMLSRAYRDKARISNNSWGAENNGVYDSECQTYDYLVRDACPSTAAYPLPGNQPMVVLVAAGNEGIEGAKTVGSPAIAKNIITVGATANVQPFGGADGCGVLDIQANNWQTLASFSSRGPCADGRIKPDVVAPGTHITGGAPQQGTPDPTGTGTVLSTFDGDGVCGGTGSSLFFPSTQQWYTASSGTSHSTPAVAGACALMRQWFLNKGWPEPSPALTKAWIGISTRWLSSVDATLMTNNQGMGLLALDKALSDTPLFMRDQETTDLFTASGQERTFYMTVSDSGNPVEITLAWTDAPGSTVGNAWNNNLDLVVESDSTYLGNNFAGEWSVKNATTADGKNNMESVRIPAGYSGGVTLRVKAVSINSDGVPNNGIALDQDFALIARNLVPLTGPMVAVTSMTVTAPALGIPANTTTPYRPATATVTLANVGVQDITNLQGIMRSNAGVSPVNGNFTVASLPVGASTQVSVEFAGLGNPGDLITLQWDCTTTVGSFVLAETARLGYPRTVTVPWTGATPIPDNSFVDIPIPVEESGPIADVRFSIDGTVCTTVKNSTTVGIAHSYVSDLIGTLSSPTGTTVTMFSAIGNWGVNICNMKLQDSATVSVNSLTAANAPFTGTYSPTSPFSPLANLEAKGNWIFRLRDTYQSDTGTVYAFTLSVDIWTQIPADEGSISCAIEPEDAVTSGAQWSPDAGTTWYNSETTATVEPGPHTVIFKNLAYWNTPSPQNVTVNKDQTVAVSGTYTRQIGELQVTLQPTEAVTAGAQWSVDGGTTWRNSGTQTTLPAGPYTVTFKPVAGWTTPASQNLTVVSGSSAPFTGTYTRQTGELQVTLQPTEAVTAGAQWSADGGATWRNSGTQISLPTGPYTVTFKPVEGWTIPATQNLNVLSGITTPVTGTYTRQTGELQVTLQPTEAVTAGAQWSVDGGTTWRNSGTQITLPTGPYTVTFKPVEGWTTPATQNPTVVNGFMIPVTGTYLPAFDMQMISGNFSSGIITPLVPGSPVDISWTMHSTSANASSFWCEVFASKTGGFDQVRFGSTVTNSYVQKGTAGTTQTIAPTNQILKTLPDGVYSLMPMINRYAVKTIDEWNFVNNWTTIAGNRLRVRTQTAATADLKLTSSTFEISTINPKTVTVTATVRNEGTSTNGECWLEVFYGDLTMEGTLDPQGTIGPGTLIPALNPGAETTFTLQGWIAGGVAPYALSAIADSTDIVPESNEVNNSTVWCEPAVVPVPPQNGVDLAITGMVITPSMLAPNQVAPGTLFNCTVSVKNNGTAVTACWLEIFGSQDGGVSFMRGSGLVDGLYITPPAPGGEQIYSFANVPLKAIGDGMYTAVAVVNRFGVPGNPGDQNPSDNRYKYAGGRVSLSTPTQSGTVNLVWSEGPTFTQPSSGTMTVTGKIKNTGSAASKAFWTEAFTGDLNKQMGFFTRDTDVFAGGALCEGLAPGAEHEISISGSVTPGQIVGILADSTDLIAETDETDNYDYSELTQ